MTVSYCGSSSIENIICMQEDDNNDNNIMSDIIMSKLRSMIFHTTLQQQLQQRQIIQLPGLLFIAILTAPMSMLGHAVGADPGSSFDRYFAVDAVEPTTTATATTSPSAQWEEEAPCGIDTILHPLRLSYRNSVSAIFKKSLDYSTYWNR